MLSPDLLTQVLRYTEQMDAEAKSIDHILDEVLAVPSVEAPARAPRRGWTVALAAAVAVFLVVGGLALAFRLLRTEQPVIEEPDPTPIETLDDFVIEDVPSFVATIEYGLVNPAAISGIVEVSYRRVDDGLRMEYVVESVTYLDKDAEPPVAGPSYQPGDFIVWDNSQVASDNTVDGPFVSQTGSSFSGLAALGWATGWSDACAQNSIEALPASIVAGRSAVHIRCTTIDGDVELWIDEETGVVLAAVGIVTIGPGGAEGVHIEPTGGYTTTAIEYLDEPAFPDEFFDFPDLEIPMVETISVPGVHFVMRRVLAAEIVGLEADDAQISEDSSRTTETWYADDTKWRTDVLDAAGTPLGGPWIGGSYTVQAEDRQLIYLADADAYVIEEGATGPPFTVQDLGSRNGAEEDPSCSPDGDATYLGRSVQRYVCDSRNMDPVERALAQEIGVPEEYVYLFDVETGMTLHRQGPGFLVEVQSIEFDAEFDDALFSAEPPSGAISLHEAPRHSAMLGQPAPPLQGTLLDGGTHDSSGWDGKRVAVLFWASWCAECVDALVAMQAASEQPGQDVVFVTVLTFDDPQEGRNALAFTGASLPVVEDLEGLTVDEWQAWDWPWLVLVDASGTVVEVRGGGFTDYIAHNFDDILANAPW